MFVSSLKPEIGTQKHSNLEPTSGHVIGRLINKGYSIGLQQSQDFECIRRYSLLRHVCADQEKGTDLGMT